jgi:hypothetical protein
MKAIDKMKDNTKLVLIVVVMFGVLYLAVRQKKAGSSAWASFPTAAEPDGTGVNFNPAFASTAATNDVLVTGEPDNPPGTCGVGRRKKSCNC